MAQSALIIGGTGQLGRAIATALGNAGWEVTVAGRGQREQPDAAHQEVLVLDREDTDALQRAARGRDLVVDTVAFTPDHARQLSGLDVGGLLVISTAAVYEGSNGSYLDIVTGPDSYPDYPVPIDEDWPTVDNAEATYSPQKAAMERVLLEGPRPVSILRAGAVHGPHSVALREWYFIQRALDRRFRVPLAWDGRGRFHPASTANVAALALACAQTGGTHVLNAVDGDCPTDAEIGRAVFEVLDHEADLVTFSGPPQEHVGASPWSTPKPFVLSMTRAEQEVGCRSLSYRATLEADVVWAVDAVRRAEQRGGSWRDVFPDLVSWGAEQWFDYEAEDRLQLRT
jgi:nucleoside-diphosphate-sugar epimerase